MFKALTLLALLALLAASASAATCPAQVTAKASLKDLHHVAYTVVVRNPTRAPLSINLRADFFYKGKKLAGGFENLQATLPAGGSKTFKGEEAFLDVLKGADAVQITRVRRCE